MTEIALLIWLGAQSLTVMVLMSRMTRLAERVERLEFKSTYIRGPWRGDIAWNENVPQPSPGTDHAGAQGDD